MSDIVTRLSAPELPERIARLGFDAADSAAVLDASDAVRRRPADLARIQQLADRLVAQIGHFDLSGGERSLEPEQHPLGLGVLQLLALMTTASEVAKFHGSRGIPPAISQLTLSDLGQQAAVHRLTYGAFGLHTSPWMRTAWSGALYWLGRLQFNLELVDSAWVLSTHIPAVGPLTPDSVEESFIQARTFFARHFVEYPTTEFHCSSWMLDPFLGQALPNGSNLSRFQQRWRLYGEPMRGDSDVLFFTFHRRGEVTLSELPRRTSLQRAVLDRLQSGRHWETWCGRIPQAAIGSGAGAPA